MTPKWQHSLNILIVPRQLLSLVESISVGYASIISGTKAILQTHFFAHDQRDEGTFTSLQADTGSRMDASSFRSHSKAVVQIAAVAHCSTFQLAKDFIRPMAGRSRRQLWAVLLVSVAVIAQVTVAAFFAPNRFLGTCLTEAWVEAKEIELNISASARDPSTKQLLYPFLHAALPGPRYTLLDSRTFNSSAYTPTCIPSSEQIFGPDAEVDPNTGTVISVGHVAGSVVLEINEGAVHRLNTMIFAIIASELIGYNVSIYYAPASMTLEKRLSLTDPQALCTPVHANVAVSNKLSMSKHGWAVLGDLGNRIIRGIYTPQNFILDGEIGTSFPEKFDADFWRDYIRSDVLIGELAESTLRNNSRYFPPNAVYCKDGVYGCRHHCSKNYACTLREEVHGKECLVIVATQSSATRAYYPAMIANLGIPAYICYIGRTGLQSFALDMLAQRRGVLFYMDYPDEFHFRFPDTFKRVLMPKGSAADIAMSTGTFGENGYGEPTSNPVRVDPFEYTMDKVTSYNILSDSGNAPVRDVFTRIRLPDTDLENILTRYVTLTNTSTQQSEDPHFDAACSWIRDNYDTWTDWMLNPLPLCTVANHMSYFISGCTEDSPSREITFGWTVPDPTNNTSPFVCDGGQMVLPSSLQTSRSCEWLENNNETWLDWIAEQPMCDSTFFSYTVGECTANNKRQISFYWLLPMPSNATTSLECEGELPVDVEVDCEYVSTRSPMYFAIAVMASLLGGVTAMSFVEVFRHRDVPIIRRSQYEFLLTMLLGCLLVCGAILLYAGEPTDSLCGARPVIISTGFTLVFGSLIVKTLRVYRIFNSKRLKRVVLPIYVMFKILAGFLFIDTAVLTVWFAIDFPSAVQSTVELTNIAASVSISQITCSSSHFIFSGLLIFWKAILLTAGLYLSFLVRKVSVDFQESIWIFASTVVVATACFMILPLAYLVPLPAATFYVFFAAVLWLATLSVGTLMLVPKVLRHREVASNTSASSTSSGDTNDNTGGHKKEQGLTLSTSKRPSPLDQPGPRVASLGHNAARVTPSHEILAVSPCRKKSLGKRTATQRYIDASK